MLPSNTIIVGMTGCGKTHYLLKMLEGQIGTYDNIYLVCPTLRWNTTYLEWKHLNNDGVHKICCEQDEVSKVIAKIVTKVKAETLKKSLIILDDCASSGDVKGRTSELVKLGFAARHIGISTIVVTQQLTSIAKAYRDNITKLVTFYNPNRKDMRVIMEEFLSIEQSEKTEILRKLKSIKYARLEINLVHPYKHEVEVPKTCQELIITLQKKTLLQKTSQKTPKKKKTQAMQETCQEK